MNRQEALAAMHEVLAILQESVIITGVSIDGRSCRVSQDFDSENGHNLIRIRCDMDNYSKGCLKPILEKHGLVMVAENGFLVISKFCP